MKILAVDDDSIFLDLFTIFAVTEGFPDVARAASGASALELLNDGDAFFDCLVFDIMMPEMDGIDLCRHVRTLPAYRKTPIIMLTTLTTKSFIDRAFEAGATDYANKPFDAIELGARLRVAEQLVVAQRPAAIASATADLQASDGIPGSTFNLPDEVQIEGIKNLIHYDALGNYLMQLSRAGLIGSQIVALRIDQIRTIHARASSDEFLHALTETADAISDTFRASGHMMAYAGNGVFVVVSHKANLEPSLGLESQIQNRIDEKNLEYDSGAPLDIEISIGNPIRPHFSKIDPSRKTFIRAMARAKHRMLKKQREPRSVNIRRVGG